MTKPFRFVDLFCGGGGSVTGAINALKHADESYTGRAFNHWDLAIRTIAKNHPEIVPCFNRACVAIEAVMPDEIFDEDPERIDCIWASPSCTHHSVAAGGRPRSNQLRSQPEYLLPYLRLTKCRRMFVENVAEMRSWGPLLDSDTTHKGRRYKAGQLDPRKRGLYFNLWIRELKASGYAVDYCTMNAADYGAATSRERLIIQAVRKSSGEKIVWPEPTHAKESGLFGYKPWRPASEIINWNLKGESIFNRKKPLAANTMRRIEAGIKRFWGKDFAGAFLMNRKGTNEQALIQSARSVAEPLPTLTTSADISLVQPLFIPQHSAGTVKPVTQPLSTIATGGAIGLVRPFLVRYNGGDNRTHETSELMPVIDTSNHYALINPIPGDALDITHRMLTVAELAAATGFPDGYKFAGGSTAAKKQIGNAVCPDLAEALYRAVLAA